MSSKESMFSRIMIGVSIILLATSLIGLLGMYRSQAVNSSQIEYNASEILETRAIHKDDAILIRRSMSRIEKSQETMQADIKKLLQTK